jgi:undecaprenyl-diphosphatase
LCQAVALGLLHGPTELLPISSSAHTTLLPWLAGWPYEEIDPRLRKSFEVALHAGTAAALLVKAPAERVGGKASWHVAALFPPAFAGYKLGGQIERRLGSPGTVLVGLLGGSFAMLAGELGKRDAASRDGVVGASDTGRHWPDGAEEPCGARGRALSGVGLCDGLALGLAQTLALMPGVSRSGATLAAARIRGFSRQDADRLSWTVGLPVIAAATLLQSARFARGGSRRASAPVLAVGAISAFLATLTSAKLLDGRHRARLFGACIAYRLALAAVVIRRMRDNTYQHNPKSQESGS